MVAMAHPRQRAIDLLQRVSGLLARKPCHGLGNEEEHERNERGGHRGTEVEHRVPRVRLEQLLGNHPSEHGAKRVSDGHDRHAEMLALRVREFRRDGIDRREHAADAEAGDDAPDTEIVDALGERPCTCRRT